MAWPPSPEATHIEVVESDASPSSILVEHFNDPFEVQVTDGTDASLQKAAHAYLVALLTQPDIRAQLPPLPGHWLVALDPTQPPHHLFGWAPFDEPQPPPPVHQVVNGPYGSFRVERAWDQLAMLFASDRLGKQDYLGTGFGLAIATRLRDDGGTLKAGFVGFSAALPYGVWNLPLSMARLNTLLSFFSTDNLFRNSAMLADMAMATTVQDISIRGVRIAASVDQWWIERRGTGIRRMAGFDVPHTVTMLTVEGGGMPATHTITHVAPLVAAVASNARVFDQDPSSATGALVRPSRDNLDGFRGVEPILPGPAGPLEHPPGVATPLVRVMRCPRYVSADATAATPGIARHVNLAAAGQPPVFGDDAAAIQAFRHARELIERLEAYGWPIAAKYFRLTAAEIKIFYRSGISPGPGKDGRTVNARVIPEGWPADAVAWSTPRPPIQIHLAAGDLRVRDRQPWVQGTAPSPAIPLGIGIDKRWMWHEFGHVLLVASTGELEFRFAHSAGDAMAAIANDPGSMLQDARRGMTFPFVFLPRQHDRCAAHGWSWSGTMHQALANVPDAHQPMQKGYASEQILSSSLFRLYRCIGGDTVDLATPPQPDRGLRERASHYTLYLIMQAMHLMGDARFQAISTPAKFVHLLRLADEVKGVWSVIWNNAPFLRVGGTVGKVIRWAFEAQGLYGAGNGPGSPEKVDIYIKDRRPSRDHAMYGGTDYGPGSYVPVSLHWQAPGGPAPAWQADAAAGITFPDANGDFEVRVGNRGATAATNVKVSAWLATWPTIGNPAPPDWSTTSGLWGQCTLFGTATQTIAGNTPPGAAFTFHLPANLLPGRYILFARATCPADRPNTDPSLLLACSTLDTSLVDLVANDNNLGLLVITRP